MICNILAKYLICASVKNSSVASHLSTPCVLHHLAFPWAASKGRVNTSALQRHTETLSAKRLREQMTTDVKCLTQELQLSQKMRTVQPPALPLQQHPSRPSVVLS